MVNNTERSESVTKYKIAIVLRNIECSNELLDQNNFSRVERRYIDVNRLRNEWKLMKKVSYQ